MATLTTEAVYREIIAACEASTIVSGFTLKILDPDVLNLRVHLLDDSFIEVLYNLATGKAAFALIVNQQRVYGKDNAKIGWHEHPWDAPEAHRTCDAVTFAAFLEEVRVGRFEGERS